MYVEGVNRKSRKLFSFQLLEEEEPGLTDGEECTSGQLSATPASQTTS